MDKLKAHEKKTILANLAAETLQRRRNLCMTQVWPWSTRDERRQTERGRIVTAADRLLLLLGDEIQRREEEDPTDGHGLHDHGFVVNAERAAAKADPSDEHARALTDAAVAVAHACREVVDCAESDGHGGYTISSDDMHQLRALLGAWSRAGERLLTHIRETAGKAA